MPRSTLGPWGKLYASTAADTAHYTDRQFRAFIGILCLAIKDRGELPKLLPLRALFGPEEVDFLVSEGRLVASPNGVMLTGWTTYQAPVDRTNADRQRRWYARSKTSSADVDNALANEHNTVSLTMLPTSTSTTEETTNEDEATLARVREGEPDGSRDALDRYYELTQSYPYGRRAGSWIEELQATHGVVHVVAALEVEHKADSSLKTLLGRVQARLERQAHRVAQAERSKPKPIDPLIAEIRAALPEDDDPGVDTSPEAIAAGKAAWEALRNGGLANGVASAVRSGSGDRVGARASTRMNGGTAGSQRPPRPAPSDLRGAPERSVQPRDGRPTPAPTDGA